MKSKTISIKKFSVIQRISICILFIMVFSTIISINVSASDTETTMSNILADATEYNGNYYLFVKDECTWQQAKLYCEGLGGHLVTITSQGEDDFCYDMWKNSGYNDACWLGATDETLEGVWKWVTAESWSYSNWGGSEPNGGTEENYLEYYGSYSDGRWNDGDDGDTFAFICEWEEENITHVKNTYGYLTGSSIIYNNAFYFNGNVYKIFEYSMSSEEAIAYCEELGGHLATITSKEEDRALYTYVCQVGNFNCILGGSDAKTEGLWEWLNGEKFDYANWNAGEPNNDGDEDFLQFSSATGKWNDIAWKNCFMCEWEDCCILSDGTVTEHNFGSSSIIEEATCTSIGKAEKTCIGCGMVVATDIEMLPHTYGEWSTKTEATCHAQGEQIRQCLDCEAFESRTTDILEHQWQDWSVSVAATCNNAGSDERHCRLCGDIEHRDVAQLTHEYSEYVVVRGSKLIPPIVKEKTCQLCGDIETQEDWSNIWITIIAVVALLGICVGVINYIRVFRKK